MIEFTPRAGDGPQFEATRWSPSDGFSARYDLDRIAACSHGPSTSWPARPMSGAFWCWMPRKVAWPPPGCCTRWRRAA